MTRTVVPSEEIVDGPAELAPSAVPSMEDEIPVASYQDWSAADTRIITCRIANDVFPGVRYETRDQAIKAVTTKYGHICEANYVPGRAFFRVKR